MPGFFFSAIYLRCVFRVTVNATRAQPVDDDPVDHQNYAVVDFF